MPGEGMDSERNISIVHSTGVKECKNAAEKTEIHKEGQQAAPDFQAVHEGQRRTYIHGDAAQLKRKVPPVIVSVVQMEGQSPLLPELTENENDAAAQKKFFVLFHNLSPLISVPENVFIIHLPVQICYNTNIAF